MDSKRFTDALKQIPLQTLLLMVAGLISVFIMMIPILACEGVIWFMNGSSAARTVGIEYLIVGFIGIVASVISVYQFMKKPGVDGAIFAQRAAGDKAKLNPLYPIMIIGVAVVIYTLVCILADFRFIADPVKYLATFFAKAANNTDMGDIPFNSKVIGYAILMVCEIPAMFLGYAKGFKERMSGNALI